VYLHRSVSASQINTAQLLLFKGQILDFKGWCGDSAPAVKIPSAPAG
jgi:hypothetical protein